MKEVVEGFKREYGFPQCAGAVDGTHIPIVSPTECPADYYIRGGIPLFYKVQWTIKAVSLTST